VTATVALVTLGIWIIALGVWALAANKSIGQKSLTGTAVLLLHDLFVGVSCFLERKEDFLSNLCLLLCRSPSEKISIAVEPLVDLLVDGVVLVANTLWGQAFLNCLCLGGGAILICSADIHGVVPTESAVSGIHICGEDAADDVTEMRHVVDVRQSTRNEDVSLARLLVGEDLSSLVQSLEFGNSISVLNVF